MKLKLTENLSNMTDSVKKYVQLQVDIAKVTAIEKATKISVSLISVIFFTVQISILLFFLLAGFVAWYGRAYGNYVTPILIVIGFIVLLMVAFIILRKSLITPKIIQTLTDSFYDEDDKLFEDDKNSVIIKEKQ